MATGVAPVYIQGPELVTAISSHVTENQNSIIERAFTARDNATQTIASISDAIQRIGLADTIPPRAPDFRSSASHFSVGGKPVRVTDFGNISALGNDRFSAQSIPEVDGVEIESFEPAFDSINLPPQPNIANAPSMPTAPMQRSITLPNRPATATRPSLPNLLEIQIPQATFAPIAPFTAQAPEFEGSSITAVLQWSPIPFTPTILTEAIAVLRRMWAGGTGLPPAVEQALWERAAGREDVAASREIGAAAAEFSGRGFTLPPGALVNRIDTIRNDAALRKQTLGRDVMIKVADAHIENLRFACQQAIAAEGVLLEQWKQQSQLQFEANKAQLDSELALLNAKVAVFNAKQSAYSTEASVHKTLLEGRALELQKFKTEVDAEIAKGAINDQRVKVYLGQYEALKADVEVFKAEMQGAQTQAELGRLEVETYKANIQAVAEIMQAEKIKAEIFESSVRGEAAKASLIDAQARAYSAYVSGKSAAADVRLKNQDAQIRGMDFQLRAFLGNLEADKAQMQAELAAIQAGVSAFTADTQRAAAEAGVEISKNEMEIKAREADMRSAIALYETEMRKYMAAREELIRIASLQADGLKAIGQMHSTLAAGAMAGVSIGSNLGASGSLQVSGSTSVNYKM